MVDSNSKTLLAFGEVLFDIINGQEHLGGAPFNVAAHFARFNNQAFLISAVGNDRKGKQVIETATQYRINTSYLKTSGSKATGIVDVSVDLNGQPSYQIVEDVAWDFIELGQEEYQSIQHKNWNCFYFGMLAQRTEVSRNTLNKVLALNQFE